MSNLTFGPSFKVKRSFTGFGELSFRCIQICIGFQMCRSSWIYAFHSSAIECTHAVICQLNVFPLSVQDTVQSHLSEPCLSENPA